MLDPAAFVADPRFHHEFSFCPSGSSRKLNVTYADYGFRGTSTSDEEKVLLWFAPMMCSRLGGIARDRLAKKSKVRVLVFDRPGVGGTNAVPGEQRIQICREITVALLARLNVKHVFFAAHSGGTVYALDTIFHHPDLLDPRHPYLALGAPWIPPKNTSASAMAVVDHLPRSFVGNYHHLLKIPALLSTFTSFGSGSFSATTPAPPPPDESDDDADDDEDVYARFARHISTDLYKRISLENLEGVSSEALLLMQKVGNHNGLGWADWESYDLLIPRFAAALRDSGRTLRVDVWYAEKDLLIGNGGTKGPEWFDHCWTSLNGAISYQSRVVKGTNHDNIWDLQWSTSQNLFEKISSA